MAILKYRRYSRVPVEIPIKFFPQNAKEPTPAYLNNLSEEGASLICPFSVPVATTLTFDVKLPKIGEAVHIRAEILWTRPVKDNGRDVFAHGLLFNRLGIEDRERLHEFISHSMSY